MNPILLQRLGASLRDMRKQRGLSQDALAKRAGTNRKVVMNAEKGAPGMSLGAFVSLAEAMGAELTTIPVTRPTTEEMRALLQRADARLLPGRPRTGHD